MRYSISNTTQKRRETELLSGIQNYGSVGKPFMMQFDAPVQAWWLVPEGCENGIPLDVSFIESDGDKYYYNGTTDLIGYLQGLGYSVPYGKYRFKVNGGGNIDYYFIGDDNITLIYTTSNISYGTWEFNIVDYLSSSYSENYKIIMDSIDSDNSGYILGVNGWVDKLYISRRDKGTGADITIFQTDDYYLTIGGDYTFKVVRNETINEFVTGDIGTFAVYIKGESFGDDYVLATPASGFDNPFTDNTHTTSTYSILTLGDGSIFKNIKINNTKITPDNFTSDIGSFSSYNELTGGINQYTDHFILDENTTLPEGLGEYSNDYSNDYKI